MGPLTFRSFRKPNGTPGRVLLLLLLIGTMRSALSDDHDKTFIIYEKDLAFDRTNHGHNGLPVWYPLTKPEIEAIRNLPAARRGDPGALLDLSILASGNRRDPASYDRLRGRIKQCVNDIRRIMPAGADDITRGKVIFSYMIDHFIRDKVNGGPGYDFGQSRITELLEGSTYNCISSALLYIVLARHFDLVVEGVIMPSHVFLQIHDKQGVTVEIETTARNGFGLVHDSTFYSAQSAAWFNNRGLQPATYQDYLNRRIVDPVVLIAGNMRNQHTSIERMPVADINRLIEIRSLLNPADANSLGERLTLYAAEYSYLMKRNEIEISARLFSSISALIHGLDTSASIDVNIQSRLAVLFAFQADLQSRTGELNEFTTALNRAFDLASGSSDSIDVYNTNWNSLNRMAGQLAESGKWGDCESMLLSHAPRCHDRQRCDQLLLWFYSEWFNASYEQKQWRPALAAAERQLQYTTERKMIEGINQNRIAIYMNGAREYYDNGQYGLAVDFTRECVENIAPSGKCAELLAFLQKKKS